MVAKPSDFLLNADPIIQFGVWYEQACATDLEMANAMTLASVDPQGWPNARIVLLKGWAEGGFRFFTNYQSPKGQELDLNPKVCAVFWWEPTHRQVRIRGLAVRIPEAESDDYFKTRDRPSQIGAWASMQSEVIPSRAFLEDAIADYSDAFSGGPMGRPDHWGGYRIVPEEIEFWQQQPHRLHDRMRYLREENGWSRQRLSP